MTTPYCRHDHADKQASPRTRAARRPFPRPSAGSRRRHATAARCRHRPYLDGGRVQRQVLCRAGPERAARFATPMPVCAQHGRSVCGPVSSGGPKQITSSPMTSTPPPSSCSSPTSTSASSTTTPENSSEPSTPTATTNHNPKPDPAQVHKVPMSRDITSVGCWPVAFAQVRRGKFWPISESPHYFRRISTLALGPVAALSGLPGWGLLRECRSARALDVPRRGWIRDVRTALVIRNRIRCACGSCKVRRFRLRRGCPRGSARSLRPTPRRAAGSPPGPVPSICC